MQIGIRALDESLNLQKIKKPLIHCINNSSEKLKESIINYNGKPIFTDILKEYVELTSKANSLLIYLKDLNEDKIEAIEKSIRIARRKGILVVLDILGANLSFPIREMALRFINRYINVKNKSLDIEAMLSGLISVGVASASNNEERFISVLVAIMTMAVSEKKAEQKNLIYSEDISFMKYLEDEIKNINANELIKLSKIDYLFTR